MNELLLSTLLELGRGSSSLVPHKFSLSGSGKKKKMEVDAQEQGNGGTKIEEAQRA